MELSTPESIRALIASTSPPRHAYHRRGASPILPAPARSSPMRHCQCGRCRQCVEDARWERIFAEKFADPDYYVLRIPRAVSPLTSL